MKIDSVSNKYLIVTLKTIFFIVLIVFIFQVFYTIQFSHKEQERNDREITTALMGYQSIVSEKLAIISSSNTFIDFLRSGPDSRERKKLDVEVLFSKFKDQIIQGVVVFDQNDESIFEIGNKSDFYVKLKLCYLNDFLDSELGNCRNKILISFNRENLVKKLSVLNSSIQFCSDCETPLKLDQEKFGSFFSTDSHFKSLPLQLEVSRNYLSIFTLELVFILLLFIIFFFVFRSFKKISETYIYGPIKKMVEGLNQGKVLTTESSDIFEINYLASAVNNFIQASQEREKYQKMALLGDMASQLAHDIRSPLETLKSLKEEIQSLPETSRRRIQLSINRIEEISFNLLKTYRQETQQLGFIRDEHLFTLLETLITQKRIEFSQYKAINLNLIYNQDCLNLFVKFKLGSLKSILSNLINNGVEALPESQGSINLELTQEKDNVKIIVRDTGKGIPESVLPKLFTKGTTSKAQGNGLGLYHARNELAAAGGSIECTSSTNQGTIFTILIPKTNPPLTHCSEIKLNPYKEIIILDDEESFHLLWNDRLKSFGVKIQHFFSINELRNKYSNLPSQTILLSDFELADKELDGIDLILKLGHQNHSILVTARADELELQQRCEQSGIKLLPKFMVNHISITNQDELKPTVYILIDDDQLTRLNWTQHFKKLGIPLHTFKSVDKFIEQNHLFSKDAAIYIDSNLENGLKGEIESEKIFNLGFKNLYLATGHDPQSFERPAWIKSILSKAPPI